MEHDENLESLGTLTPTQGYSSYITVYKNKYNENVIYFYSTKIYFAVDCSELFSGCSALISIDFGTDVIDTSNMTVMGTNDNYYGMFSQCAALTSLDLSEFDTSKVTDMSYIFSNCNLLTSLTLPNTFITSNVTNMAGMFYQSSALTTNAIQSVISQLNTSNVTNMSWMFADCNLLTSLTLPNTFTTSKVTDMSGMFYGCRALTTTEMQSILARLDTTKVINISQMFEDCNALTLLDLSNFDITNVTNMGSMFWNCSKLTSLTLPNTFTTSKVTDMYGMFYGCSSLSSTVMQSAINYLDTTLVTDMYGMFSGCSALTSLILPSTFTTSKVTDMSNMFSGCNKLTTLDISNFDTTNVTNMSSMFSSCSKLTSLTLSNTFTTSKVTSMTQMFYGCSKLDSLDLSNFDMTKCTKSNSVSNMFYNCTSLSEIYSPKNIQVAITLPSGTYYKVTGMAGSYVKDGDAITTIPVGTDSIHILKEVSMTLNANTGAFTGTNTGWTISAPTATKTALYGNDNLSNVSVSKQGFVVDSWNTVADGTGTKYELNSTIPAGVTLYAQYRDPSLPVTGVDIGVGTLIASVLATLLLACGLVLVLNKKKRYK